MKARRLTVSAILAACLMVGMTACVTTVSNEPEVTTAEDGQETTQEPTAPPAEEQEPEPAPEPEEPARWELGAEQIIPVSQPSGYTADATIQITSWIPASDKEAMQQAWEAVDGSGPCPEVNSSIGESLAGYTTDNAAVLFGTLKLEYTTENFPFPQDGFTFHVPLAFRCLTDGDDARSVGGYIDTSEPHYIRRNMYVALEPHMSSETWGPVAFMLAIGNAYTPKDPSGSMLDTMLVTFDSDPLEQPARIV